MKPIDLLLTAGTMATAKITMVERIVSDHVAENVEPQNIHLLRTGMRGIDNYLYFLLLFCCF